MAESQLQRAKLQVMEAVPYVQKHRPASGCGVRYSFVAEADLIERLHPAMVQAGLTIRPARVTLASTERYETGKGTGMVCRVVIVTYVLSHVSGESEEITVAGEGFDTGDKAIPKALTGAYKYALRQAFLIETGDDPDHTPSPQSANSQGLLAQRPATAEVISPQQYEWLRRQLWDLAGHDKDFAMSLMGELLARYGAKQLQDIGDLHWSDVRTWLARRSDEIAARNQQKPV